MSDTVQPISVEQLRSVAAGLPAEAILPFTPTTSVAAGDVNITFDDEKALLRKENVELKDKLSHAVLFESDLIYQGYIDAPPVKNTKDLYHRACSSDGVTIDSWIDTWIKQMEDSMSKYDVANNDCYSEFAKCAYKPVICAGSGPSLRRNAQVLVANKGKITIVSCLHNFGYFEDLGIMSENDYYMNLDSGPITIPEMSQGGTKDAEHYWEQSRNRTLVTAITGNPELHEKWRGRKLFYGVVASSPQFVNSYFQLRDKYAPGFNTVFSVGGNSLGACVYFAKAILGACPIVFVGADFSFSYDKKFHPFSSPYDQQYSGIMTATDVFGNKVGCWQSYFNFKCFFDYLACGGQGNQPGMWINCTEGGLLGAYQEGNIRQITQMPLKHLFWSYCLHEKLPDLRTGNTHSYLF